MKQALLFTALLFWSLHNKAQSTEVFQELKNLMYSQHPELDLTDKLIAINIWSVSDKNSRESNKAFEKVCSTYSYAKLQGGKKGVVVVLVNKDNLDEYAIIVLGKDGHSCSYSFKWLDLNTSANWPKNNLVFNANGEILHTDLAPENIFSSFQSLITR